MRAAYAEESKEAFQMFERFAAIVPPEAGPAGKWGKPADIYMLGSILDVMLDSVEGRDIKDCSPWQKYKMELAMKYGDSVTGQGLPVSPGLVEEMHLRYLFSVMMSAEPEKRPTAGEVFEYLRASRFRIAIRRGYGTYQGDKDDDPEITSGLCGECCPATNSILR